MKKIKERLIALQSIFTQNEIAKEIWVNRTVIFHEKSDLSLKTLEKIMGVTWLTYEEINNTQKLELTIQKWIYAKRYKYHISEAEKYHTLLTA